jgi:hypothetical protein
MFRHIEVFIAALEGGNGEGAKPFEKTPINFVLRILASKLNKAESEVHESYSGYLAERIHISFIRKLSK